MKTYRIITKDHKVIQIKADEVVASPQMLVFHAAGKLVATFNMAEIIGFVQSDQMAA